MNKRNAGCRRTPRALAYRRGIVDVHEEIVEAMARGERVTFWNFGRWELKTTAARVGREFKTGKSVVIPERNKVCFTASPNLVAAVEDAMKTL
ncbi:MAG: HU family DNA-binding protein [Sutterella wadsworthensis]